MSRPLQVQSTVIAQPSPPPRRGRLRHGNPSGDYAKAPRCGARTRAGCCCRQPAMKNGRCRMHGGLSTGPRTAEGLARSRRARWKHGFDSAAIRALRRETMLTARRLAGLVRLANAKFPRADFPLRSPRGRRRADARPRPAAAAPSSGTRMPSSLGMGSIARNRLFVGASSGALAANGAVPPPSFCAQPPPPPFGGREPAPD
ncbi:MAG: HGGxSTG domain-containing protein [Hyphomicrobiaceae bacterium]